MRDKPWPYYNQWCLIFGKERANGEHAECPVDMVEGLEREKAAEDNENVAGMSVGLDDTSVSTSVTQTQNEDAENSQGKKQKRKKASGSDAWAAGLGEMAKALTAFISDSSQKLDIIAQRVGYAHDAAEARRRVNGELERIEGLARVERLRAGSMIVGDPQKVDYFFSLSDCDKAEWVRLLLSGLL
ncbi:unnamed protein product [Ilex paraguariensis]